MEKIKEGLPLESSKNVTKILGVDIIFPSSDAEGPNFAKKLDELIKEIGFTKEQINIIRASLIIAKQRGTEENKYYVPYIKGRRAFYLSLPDDLKNIQETSWLRRSGRTAMAHFLESAIIALEAISKFNIDKIDKNILTKIICIALLHDTVEDSKGLYDYEDLGYDLGWWAMKPFINTNYCRFRIFSFLGSNLDIHFGYRYRKTVEDIIEGVKRLTIEKEDKDLVDLVIKLVPNIEKGEDFEKYKREVVELLSEYERIHLDFKKEIKEASKQGDIKFRERLYYISQIRPKEEEILSNLVLLVNKFLEQISFEKVDYLDAISILVRLSETITAIGPIDIEGFTKGEYGISNIDMKQVIYLPFLRKVSPLLDKFFGEGTSSRLEKIFNIYLEGAKKIVEAKLNIERLKYEFQRQLSSVLNLNK